MGLHLGGDGCYSLEHYHHAAVALAAHLDERACDAVEIAAVYQHAASYPDLSVAENIFIGHEFKIGPFIDWPKMNREAKKLLDSIDAKVSPTASVGSLTVGQQQLVAIARAITFKAKVIVMDEPTASLSSFVPRRGTSCTAVQGCPSSV